MNVLSVFRDAFGCTPRTVPSERAIIRGIVSRYSEGNVSLQAGQYITQEDVTRVMKELRNHRFKDAKTR